MNQIISKINYIKIFIIILVKSHIVNIMQLKYLLTLNNIQLCKNIQLIYQICLINLK